MAVGGNTVDTFVKTEADLIQIKKQSNGTMHNEPFLAYPVGAKILIKHLEFQVGGGGTNTAVAFSRLGLRTGYLGKVGNDENGKKVIDSLKKEDVAFLGTMHGQTGYSVILDSNIDDRTILTFRGANDELSYEEINKAKLSTKWFFFATMMNKSLETMKKLAAYAQKNNIKVAFNTSTYLASKGIDELNQILKATNILIVNREEAELLTGKNDLKSMIKTLKKHVKEYAVITDGKHGASCYDGKKLYTMEPLDNLRIIETTGAGDAFSSAFTTAIIIGKTPEQALKMAFIQSESVIQAYGAKNILLTRKQIEEKLKKDTRPIKIHNI